MLYVLRLEYRYTSARVLADRETLNTLRTYYKRARNMFEPVKKADVRPAGYLNKYKLVQPEPRRNAMAKKVKKAKKVEKTAKKASKGKGQKRSSEKSDYIRKQLKAKKAISTIVKEGTEKFGSKVYAPMCYRIKKAMTEAGEL